MWPACGVHEAGAGQRHARRRAVASRPVSGGHPDPRDLDPATTVVVPAQPGPVRALAAVDGPRDDLDAVLDDVFGPPDDGGAGPLAAALLLVGAAAIVAGLTSLVPTWVLVAGLVVFGLGAVLPLRSLWRRAATARRATRPRAGIGDGVPLRTDQPAVAGLVAAHARCREAAAAVAAPRRVQVEAVAHAALLEAATLLDGRSPGSAAEAQYVVERVGALDALAAAVAAVPADDERRRARTAARLGVERLAGGSAVQDAAALARELRGAP
jgi:hypothetical protein